MALLELQADISEINHDAEVLAENKIHCLLSQKRHLFWVLVVFETFSLEISRILSLIRFLKGSRCRWLNPSKNKNKNQKVKTGSERKPHGSHNHLDRVDT